MVKYLPKALLLALLMGAPVMAVDYVKCDAIQRAYSRLVFQKSNDDYWINVKDNTLWKLCPFAFNLKDYDEMVKAEREWKACKLKPENIATAETAANKATPSYIKKINKVAADYYAAKCP